MRYAKFFGLLALAAGMASAADWRDVRNDYARVAHDRARMHEDVRCERRTVRDRRDVRREYHGREWR
jgi:hypothetical protein